MRFEKNFVPTTLPIEAIDSSAIPGEEAPHFVVTPEYTDLSPDEAWTVKHFIAGVDETSPYRKLYDHLSQHFVAGVYEHWLGMRVQVSHEDGKELAGVYTGIYWVVKDEQPEEALHLRARIEAIVQHQPPEVQEFFAKQLVGPLPENSQN